MGIGDRFGRQGQAQLKAIQRAVDEGIDLYPIWNKSNREHGIVGTIPDDVRREADAATDAMNWNRSYYVDADHINLGNVDKFIAASDFFTLDVADYIGTSAEQIDIDVFVEANSSWIGQLRIPGIENAFTVDATLLTAIAHKFLYAINQAEKIYQKIQSGKNDADYVIEVSMDEVDEPQSPVELFFILQMIASKGIPAQTIAPKFTGRFNKGVDYVGDIAAFAQEFESDLCVIDYAIMQFHLPATLKLSVHSGSDKFSIYPIISRLLRKHDKGLHLKTAGTTWLEETIGLAVAEGDGLEIVKTIYAKALEKREALCAPYSTVIDIDPTQLPSAQEVATWSGKKLADSLRHIPEHPDYNPNMRQLVHVAYKVAADMGNQYLDALEKYRDIVSEQVVANIYERHICRLFKA